MLNDEWVLRQARLFADRVKEAAPDDPARQVDLAYRIALTRPPREKEMTLGLDFLKRRSLDDFTHVLLNLNESLYVRWPTMKHFWSRRDFLFQSGGSIAGVALASLLSQGGLLAAKANEQLANPGPSATIRTPRKNLTSRIEPRA
jgi:hypothetical protein